MKLSVIIPTHNRADILRTCLEKLMVQKGVDFEVIVVDDGSEDLTSDVMRNFREAKYIQQKASHQGVARNRGAKEASGDILVFIGDDIFVEPGFLMQHANIHIKNPGEDAICLGRTDWDPDMEKSDYMKFLDESGWQFAYFLLSPGFTNHPQPYKFFYTSNISIKKTVFDKEKFNKRFTEYGWEDIELGYRLWSKHAMRLYYEPDAKAFHHHFIPDSTLEGRMEVVGRSAVTCEKIQPEMRLIPRGLKAFILKIISLPLILPFSSLLGRNFYWKIKSWKHFFKGVKQARKS